MIQIGFEGNRQRNSTLGREPGGGEPKCGVAELGGRHAALNGFYSFKDKTAHPDRLYL